jgi:hypothetical protein
MTSSFRISFAVLFLAAPALAQTKIGSMAPVPPEHGLPAVGPFKPTWCDEAGSKANADALDRIVRNDQWDDLDKSIEQSCLAPDDPAFHAFVGMYVQKWVNATGVSPAQVAEMLNLAAQQEVWKKQIKETCEKLEEPPEGSPREKQLRELEAKLFGCSSGRSWYHLQSPGNLDSLNASMWAVDRSPKLSQLATLQRVLTCQQRDLDVRTLTQWAICRFDAQRLDQATLEAELKAGGFNDFARIVATQALSRAKLMAVEFDAALMAKAKDHDMKAVLVDAPQKAWAAWEADVAANQAAVEAAWAYEDLFYGPRKSAAKNCLPSVEKALQTAAGTSKAQTHDELMSAASSGIGPILLEHLRTCHLAEGHTGAASFISSIIKWGAPARGPRTAATIAMARAASPILADRPAFPIKGNMLAVYFPSPGEVGLGSRDRMNTSSSGVVKAIVKKGDRLFITFNTVVSFVKERDCKPTNRIIMFKPDGVPIYDQDCRYTGKMLKREDTAYPFWTWANFGTGIKPGAYVVGADLGDPFDSMSGGVPIEVWANKDQKKLVAAMGMATR